MSGSKQIMVNTFISSIILALLLANSPYMTAHAAPQAGAASAASSAQKQQAATTTSTTTTSTSNTAAAAGSSAASGAAGGGAAAAAVSAASGGATPLSGPFAGVQGLVGGALNIAALPLNTISASLNQLGIPTIATAPLSAVSSLFQQAGTVYGR